ncbi:hypothetical protein JW992_02750, partial [candidate division KSB1 bacterium]|nr:hypothetical protein [candidate division KSB1 bacterium]
MQFFKALAIVFLVAGCSGPQLADPAFFVSPYGCDDWSGRSAEPNSDGSDGPFITLERARQAIRDYKTEGGLAEEGITVYLRG